VPAPIPEFSLSDSFPQRVAACTHHRSGSVISQGQKTLCEPELRNAIVLNPEFLAMS
jgi:hypothetical protein